VSGGATLNVSAAALYSITVTPSPASITAGQTQTFSAAGADQYGNAVTITPTWSASSSDAGCANSASWAQRRAGTYTVTATSGAVSGGATLNVSAAALYSITVTPSPASITAGQTQTFSAAGADQYGNAVTITPTWSASSSDAGCANSA